MKIFNKLIVCILLLVNIQVGVFAEPQFIPVIDNGIAFIKIRNIANTLGIGIGFKPENNEVRLDYNNEYATLVINTDVYNVNGNEISGAYSLRIINNSAYISVYDINTLFKNVVVVWNISNGTVDLSYRNGAFEGFSLKRKVFIYSLDGLNRTEIFEDKLSDYNAEWSIDKPKLTYDLILVNQSNLLPSEFQPLDIVSVNNTEYELNTKVANEVVLMLSDAQKNGYNKFVITSGFRTFEYQKQLFDKKVKELKKAYGDKAEQKASLSVAYPNASEHQTGLAVDIGVTGYGEDIQNYKGWTWLVENCYKYGFILRYPKDKTDITKTKFEPWHFRYIGKDYSKIVWEKGMCYEEFYETLHFEK